MPDSSPGPASTLESELEALAPWYHTIDLGNDTRTPGRSPAAAKFKHLEPHLPKALSGMKVLDLGCNAGGISVAFARRGAHVTGVEMLEHYHRQALWIRDTLGLSNFEPVRMPIYEIGQLEQDFDIVLFLGLLYHLRYPQLAIDLAASLCRGLMFLSSPKVVTEASILESRLPAEVLESEGDALAQYEEARFNWWFPSEAALRSMLRAAGFRDVTVIGGRDDGFRSSDPATDNTSAYPTGMIQLMAQAAVNSSLPRPVNDWNAERRDGSRNTGNATTPTHTSPSPASLPKYSELELMLRYLEAPSDNAVMIDVGAHVGSVSRAFAARGWRCVAFEPASDNFAELQQTLSRYPNSTAVDKAVSDETRTGVVFYRSTEFWGIHSLVQYDETHREKTTVDTVRLDDALGDLGIGDVDVLKIDAEGADFPALRSLDFQRFRPRLVMTEFADDRTRPVGYDHHDVVRYMSEHGYAAWISEWAPIVSFARKGETGAGHTFLRCCPYPVRHEPAWGNLLFVPEADAETFDAAVAAYLGDLTERTKRSFAEVEQRASGVQARPATPGSRGPRPERGGRKHPAKREGRPTRGAALRKMRRRVNRLEKRLAKVEAQLSKRRRSRRLLSRMRRRKRAS